MSNVQTPASLKLRRTTYDNIGKDLSPQENAFGCAETVCTLLALAFNDTWKTLSTKLMYEHFLISPYYSKESNSLAGDIVISPTGYGNGKISNGHVGIVLNDELIASNNSYNSKLEVNYNLKSWKAR